MVSQVPHSSFIEATKEDVRVLLKWMEETGYKAFANEKFSQG
jgi:hypothetical protein